MVFDAGDDDVGEDLVKVVESGGFGDERGKVWRWRGEGKWEVSQDHVMCLWKCLLVFFGVKVASSKSNSFSLSFPTLTFGPFQRKMM